MAAPSPHVRSLVLLRDGSECVSCSERTSPLEMQHRQRVGGGGSKHRPQPHELATACSTCNNRFEHNLQDRALAFGWKVRVWVDDPSRVPMLHRPRGRWGLLTVAGGVRLISQAEAIDHMHDVYGDQWNQWARKTRLLTAATEGMR